MLQTTDDGEYIPDKELNVNFKIPKTTVNKSAAVHQWAGDVGSAATSTGLHYGGDVLDGLYANCVPPPPPAPTFSQAAHYCKQPAATASITIDNNTNQITTKILSALHREKPKTYEHYRLKNTIPDCDDPSLPSALTAQFQPLYCKLCTAQLSSNVNAKLHYSSKNHEKKIRKYLIEYADRTGEPLHKRARVEPAGGGGAAISSSRPKEAYDPSHFHCNVCDLPLTGRLHAESHYMGRNHQKALLGHKNPAGKGYYDADGKWVRELSTSKLKQVNTEQGDTFGLDFRTGGVVAVIGRQSAAVVAPSPTSPPSSSTVGFRCELCSISTTCREQLDTHYKGQKHQKKLRMTTARQFIIDNGVNDGATVKSVDSILSSVLSSTKSNGDSDSKKGDLSVYRTPSGNYYCRACNLTVNSELQLRQHLDSKNHIKKCNQQKECSIK